MVKKLDELPIKIFADGASLTNIARLAALPWIKGFTTNPTLMRKAGVDNYYQFGHDALNIIGTKPISFEVFADEPKEMIEQAREIASWGQNVYVKIPVMNTQGDFMGPVIRDLSAKRVKLNVTAVFTLEQITAVLKVLDPKVPTIMSVFAGRIADTGVDPSWLFHSSHSWLTNYLTELLWASPRQVLDIFKASDAGAHIITVTPDILDKVKLLGKNLEEYSRETVQMFYDDAKSAGYKLSV